MFFIGNSEFILKKTKIEESEKERKVFFLRKLPILRSFGKFLNYFESVVPRVSY